MLRNGRTLAYDVKQYYAKFSAITGRTALCDVIWLQSHLLVLYTFRISTPKLRYRMLTSAIRVFKFPLLDSYQDSEY